MIKVCCGTFHALEWNVKDPIVGQEVVVLGYALGLEGAPTITRGIVSARRGLTDANVDVIQTDAAVNRGNSGGPMVTRDGKVLGMTTFKFSSSEGLGFAIDGTAVRLRAQALANPDITEYKGRQIVREAGPASIHGLTPIYATAGNFIAQADMTVTNEAGLLFAVAVKSYRQDSLLVSPKNGCIRATSVKEDIQIEDTSDIDSRLWTGKVEVRVAILQKHGRSISQRYTSVFNAVDA